MEQLDDLQALTQSIGEHILDLVGRQALYGLQIVLDARTFDGNVALALRDNTMTEHDRVWACIFEIEDMFSGEVVLHYWFVGPDDLGTSSVPGAIEYSYA